jgi:hypothetical protein
MLASRRSGEGRNPFSILRKKSKSKMDPGLRRDDGVVSPGYRRMTVFWIRPSPDDGFTCPTFAGMPFGYGTHAAPGAKDAYAFDGTRP